MRLGPADLVLAVPLTLVWMVSWWRGTRRFRLWFALWAPAGCVGGALVALIGAIVGSAPPGVSCNGPCSGRVPQQWADTAGTPPAASVWLGENSVVALGVALALTVVTLTVEYLLLVRRDSRAG